MPSNQLDQAMQEFAREYGREHRDVAWIAHPSFTDYYVENPFYKGAPVPHPLDNIDEDFDDIDEDDGQPDEYTEWQDYMGGDDWDHGQFDDSYF